jgi:LysM repeat protein
LGKCFLQLDAAGKEVFHSVMKKISLWLFVFVFAASTAGVARAQDTATQQQLDQLSGQIQEYASALALQTKRIDALEKKISDLQDKMNQSATAPATASADDLKKLAAQVQALAKKQQSDNDLVLKELEKLAKGGSASAPSRHSTANSETSSTSTTTGSTTTAGPQQNGYEYPIANGDTVEAIARAYRAKGVKVTSEQILAANPGLNPNKMIVGKKIFIPDPNAK